MIALDVTLRRDDFHLEARFQAEGGVTALFGPSGSGKSTLIALMAGLARPDRGRIVLDGRVLVDTESGVFVPPHRRRIGLVFQDARLFPHLSVRNNLLFGSYFAPRAERRLALGPVVETLGIGHLLRRRPLSLSGGERQRVAIGRALLASPRLLLMDEPLASLDLPRRLEILPLIERLRDEFALPVVYVSHALEEVARLAARVVVLERGHVAAIGAPGDVLGPPGADTSRFDVASILSGRLGTYEAPFALTQVDHPAGRIYLSGRVGPEGREVRLVVRAIDVTLATRAPDHVSVRTTLEGRVTEIVQDTGPVATVHLALRGGDRLTASVTRKGIAALDLRPGSDVHALVKTVALDERTLAGE